MDLENKLKQLSITANKSVKALKKELTSYVIKANNQYSLDKGIPPTDVIQNIITYEQYNRMEKSYLK